MIDFHSHILPGVDDGSKNTKQTIEMLEEAKTAGFSAIIVTPHYMEGSYEMESQSIQTIIGALLPHTSVKLYIGNEGYASMELPKLIKEKKVSTVNNGSYLLFELPMNLPVIFLEDLIYELQSRDIVPIIAHPERYAYVQKNPNWVQEWIERGVLFQSNYGSLIGIYGKSAKKTILKLLKNNCVHFLGTDCHRPNSIYQKMPEILKELKKIIGEDVLFELTEGNARKIINNEKIEIRKPKRARGGNDEKIFWNRWN